MALWRCNGLALIHVGKSFIIRSYEKCAGKSFGMSGYKIVGLKVSWNQQLQEMWGCGVTNVEGGGRTKPFSGITIPG